MWHFQKHRESAEIGGETAKTNFQLHWTNKEAELFGLARESTSNLRNTSRSAAKAVHAGPLCLAKYTLPMSEHLPGERNTKVRLNRALYSGRPRQQIKSPAEYLRQEGMALAAPHSRSLKGSYTSQWGCSLLFIAVCSYMYPTCHHQRRQGHDCRKGERIPVHFGSDFSLPLEGRS